MKKGFLLVLLFIGFFLAFGDDGRGMDVAKLQPVEVICVSAPDGRIQVQTDTKASGTGENLEDAFDDLEQTTPGIIFLETADHLILYESALSLLPQLTSYLRPGCTVCLARGEANPEDAAAFLAIHPPQVTVNDIRADDEVDLPILHTQEGVMRLE